MRRLVAALERLRKRHTERRMHESCGRGCEMSSINECRRVESSRGQSSPGIGIRRDARSGAAKSGARMSVMGRLCEFVMMGRFAIVKGTSRLAVGKGQSIKKKNECGQGAAGPKILRRRGVWANRLAPFCPSEEYNGDEGRVLRVAHESARPPSLAPKARNPVIWWLQRGACWPLGLWGVPGSEDGQGWGTDKGIRGHPREDASPHPSNRRLCPDSTGGWTDKS
ncbi:hypothetical protein ACJZ2D_015474 [Fusarium nematophilum]